MLKSPGFSSRTGLLSYPLMRTSSTTNCVVVLMRRSVWGPRDCCAEAGHSKHPSSATKDRDVISKPKPKRELHRTHRTSGGRQSKLGVAKDGIPGRERNMVQHVCG